MLIALPIMLNACGGSGTTTSEATTTDAFPSALAVSSPLSYSTSSTSENLSSYSTSGMPVISAYTDALSSIHAIINGSTPTSCAAFDPSLFLTQEEAVDCYGPEVSYENHPDATSGPSDGTLPTDDVGIWLANDSTTGNACMAAKLNAEIQSNADHSNASLMALASLLCTANVNSIALPDDKNPTC